MSTPTAIGRPGEAKLSDGESNHAMRWWILAVLGLAQLMVILDNTIVNIALPTAQRALHFSNADRQWVVTGYSLAFGSLLLLGGRIGDFIGRKRALLIGLIGFAGASAVGGASVSFAMLVTARTVQGAFGAVLAPSVLALLTTSFTNPDERGKAFAIYGGIAGAGGAIGLLLGGILTSYASWRWTLFVNLAFAGVATIGALLWLKNDRATDHDPLDIPGVALVTSGLFCVVFGLSHAETTAWSNPFTIGFLVVGVLLLAGFAYLETRASYPLLPPRVVRNRTRGGSILAMLSASIGMFGVFLFLTYYLQDTLGFSPVMTGFAFLPMVAVLVLTAQVSNRVLLPKVGPKIIVPIGLVVSAAAMFGLHLVGLHTSYASHVLPYLLAAGPRLRAECRPLFQRWHPRTAAKRRRGRVGHPQHEPAGRGVHRYGTAQHAGRRSRHRLHGRAGRDPANLRMAALHSYTTAFLWSAAIFVLGAVAAGAVLERGNLRALAGAPATLIPSPWRVEGAAPLRRALWRGDRLPVFLSARTASPGGSATFQRDCLRPRKIFVTRSTQLRCTWCWPKHGLGGSIEGIKTEGTAKRGKGRGRKGQPWGRVGQRRTWSGGSAAWHFRPLPSVERGTGWQARSDYACGQLRDRDGNEGGFLSGEACVWRAIRIGGDRRCKAVAPQARAHLGRE